MKAVLACLLVLVSAPAASAQTQGDGARVYWKTLAGANAVTFWPMFIGGNANPFDPAHTVTPQTEFDGMVALVGAHKILPIAGRSSTLSLIVPVGNVSGTVAGDRGTIVQTSRGFGDPVVQLNVNLAGAPAMRTLVDASRYEPRFTVDLLGAIAIPVGEHSAEQAVNLGQDRWYGRIGAPVMIALAPWVPGRRTTVEVVPAVWLFGDADNGAGRVLKNEALVQLEAHVTRDLSESMWASFDTSWLSGAKPTVNGVTREAHSNAGVGFTLGFQVTPSLGINTSYFSTVSDSGATDLRSDEFRVMFTYGWHKLIEGMKRLGHE
jgi:hypothetical protein